MGEIFVMGDVWKAISSLKKYRKYCQDCSDITIWLYSISQYLYESYLKSEIYTRSLFLGTELDDFVIDLGTEYNHIGLSSLSVRKWTTRLDLKLYFDFTVLQLSSEYFYKCLYEMYSSLSLNSLNASKLYISVYTQILDINTRYYDSISYAMWGFFGFPNINLSTNCKFLDMTNDEYFCIGYNKALEVIEQKNKVSNKCLFYATRKKSVSHITSKKGYWNTDIFLHFRQDMLYSMSFQEWVYTVLHSLLRNLKYTSYKKTDGFVIYIYNEPNPGEGLNVELVDIVRSLADMNVIIKIVGAWT